MWTANTRWGALTAAAFLITGVVIRLRAGALPRDWYPVRAEILESSLNQKGIEGQATDGRRRTFAVWRLRVSYRYVVGGKTFLGKEVAPNPVQLITMSEASPAPRQLVETQRKLTQGVTVFARVSPRDPSKAYLISWSTLFDRVLSWSCIAISILTALIVLARARRQ